MSETRPSAPREDADGTTASLQLPASFYGLYRDVKREMSKVATKLRRGEDWVAAIEARGFLDVASTPGHIVIEGPSSLVGGEDHFHTFVFLRLVFDRLNAVPGVREQVFERSITTVWGHPEPDWVRRLHADPTREPHPVPARGGHLLGRARGGGSPIHRRLAISGVSLALADSLKYVLANQGVPVPALNSPLPPGGLLALIRQHGIDFTA